MNRFFFGWWWWWCGRISFSFFSGILRGCRLYSKFIKQRPNPIRDRQARQKQKNRLQKKLAGEKRALWWWWWEDFWRMDIFPFSN